MAKEGGNTLTNTPYTTGKFIEEAKRKEFFQKKTDMLKKFDVMDNEKEKLRSHSPTTETMLNSLNVIGN